MFEKINSILIIRYSSMGDVILTAPLIAALKMEYPQASIALLTKESYAELFNDDTRLSSVYSIRKKELSSDPLLFETMWDLIIDLQNNKHSARQIESLNYRDVRKFNKLHWERLVLLLFRINLYPSMNSVPMRYIRTGEIASSEVRLDFRLHFNAVNTRAFEERLQSDEIKRPVIALFPFSAWKNKEWGDKKFAEVGRFFIIKGWNVVVLGGVNDIHRAERLQKTIGERCISLAGELSLYECGCVLKGCTLALGNDTGLTHLARACGVITGYIFGSTTAHFGFYPHQDKQTAVFEQALFCRPCHPHGGRFCWRVDHACMHRIKPEQVINGLMQLHEGCQ